MPSSRPPEPIVAWCPHCVAFVGCHASRHLSLAFVLALCLAVRLHEPVILGPVAFIIGHRSQTGLHIGVLRCFAKTPAWSIFFHKIIHMLRCERDVHQRSEKNFLHRTLVFGNIRASYHTKLSADNLPYEYVRGQPGACHKNFACRCSQL